MSIQESTVSPQNQSKRRANPLGSKRTRLLINIGCLPAVMIVTLALLLALNVMAFWQAPSWVTDKRSYLAAGRLVLSIGTLAGLQLLATWAVGLLATLLGIRAAVGQGRLLTRRLEVIRRRIAISAWAIVAIRLLTVCVAIIAGINLFTSLFGFRLDWSFADDALSFIRSYWVLFWILAMICLTQFLVGPLLRLRYSLALGALAGAWTQNRDYRPWLALSLRLGMGLAGLVGLMWTVAGLRLLATIVFDPLGYPVIPRYPELFPLLPPGASSAATALVFVTAALVVHSIVQIISTRVALSAARARLARPKRLGYYATTAASFRQMAKASAPRTGD